MDGDDGPPTGIDEVLVGEAGVVDVVDGTREDGRHYFQIREDILKMGGIDEEERGGDSR